MKKSKTSASAVREPKKILLSVIGLTPQIITETLFALYKEDDLPNRIVIVTTAQGKLKAVDSLLNETSGKFHEFCREYNLSDQIEFSESDIRVIRTKDGEALNDIRTPEQNSAAADCIMSTVQELCSNPNNRIHLSIAGGRKSMGFLAGYALSIFGRKNDRLSHVLVSDPFENNPEFFYPTKESQCITLRDGQKADLRDAQVSLAKIPFVRFSTGATSDIFSGCRSFEEAVKITQQNILLRHSLIINVKDRSINCGGSDVKMPPMAFLLYLWFAKRAQEGLQAASGYYLHDEEKGLEELNSFLNLTKETFGPYSTQFERLGKNLKTPEDLRKFFNDKNSQIKTSIRRDVGISSVPDATDGDEYQTLASPYLVKTEGKRGYSTYRITLPPEAITINKY